MIINPSKILKNLHLFRTQFKAYLCTTNNETTYLRDRAILASNIIKRIWTKNNIDQLSHLTLHQSIIKYLESVKNVDDKPRLQLLEDFKTGIQHDPLYMPKFTFKNSQMDKGGRIKIYPTKTVTSLLFQKILNQSFYYQCYRKLLVGNYGISKSLSTILFAHLSNMVEEYNFKTYPKQWLRNKNIGIIRSPKVFYYNFEQDHLLKNQIKDKILKQLSQEISPQNLPNYLNNIIFMPKRNPKFQDRQIQSAFHQKKILAIIIIDQISEYFSLLRRFEPGQVNKGGFERKKIQKFDYTIKTFQCELDGVIYLSSSQQQYERQFLDQTGLNDQNTKIQTTKLQKDDKKWRQDYMKQVVEIFLEFFQKKFNLRLLNPEQNDEKSVQFKAKVESKLLAYLNPKGRKTVQSLLDIQYTIMGKFQTQMQDVENENKIREKIDRKDPQTLENEILQLFKETIESHEGKNDGKNSQVCDTKAKHK